MSQKHKMEEDLFVYKLFFSNTLVFQQDLANYTAI